MKRVIFIERGGRARKCQGGGCQQQNLADIRRRRREKEGAGSGLRECEAGYETNKYGELRVLWKKALA